MIVLVVFSNFAVGALFGRFVQLVFIELALLLLLLVYVLSFLSLFAAFCGSYTTNIVQAIHRLYYIVINLCHLSIASISPIN